MSGHVIALDLSCSNLHGQFNQNSSIFKLRQLQQLNLAYNDFSDSSLYSGIGHLMNLRHLNLSNSGMGGDIPSTISHLSKLVSLDLNYLGKRLDPYTWNKLIHNATNLREIHLNGVDMSSIRKSSLSLLANLSSSLVSLSFEDTKLQGNWPADILCLPNLQKLSLSYNQNLKGELQKPNWSSPLRYLYISFTAFSGHIPNSIGHLKFLEKLSFLDSNFDGPIPSSLFNLTQLFTLDLSYNKLVGPIPSEINELPNLRYLNLECNMLSRTIPRWCYSPNMSYLNLKDNQLTGSIDEFSTMCNAKFLLMLNLAHNNLTGLIPQSLGALLRLEVLDLQMNNLYGNIHLNLANAISIFTINLNGNLLEGQLPRSLVHCKGLQVLDLGYISQLARNSAKFTCAQFTIK